MKIWAPPPIPDSTQTAGEFNRLTRCLILKNPLQFLSILCIRFMMSYKSQKYAVEHGLLFDEYFMAVNDVYSPLGNFLLLPLYVVDVMDGRT